MSETQPGRASEAHELSPGSGAIRLASRRRRIVAYLFDHFLFSMLGASTAFALLGPRWDMDPRFDRAVLMPVFFGLLALFFCKDAIGGQSIGRAIFAISVRAAEDPAQTPPVARLIRRNLFLPIWPVELLALALSATKQRIGDRLAETCVVRVPAPLRPRLLAGLGFGLALTLVFLVASTHLVRSSAAYAVATERLRSDPAVAAEIGGVTGFGALPAGSIRIQNGQGRAELTITVEGELGLARTFVLLEKSPGGEWEVSRVRIE